MSIVAADMLRTDGKHVGLHVGMACKLSGSLKRRLPLAEVLQDRGVDIATEELKMFEDFDTDLDAESCQGTSGRRPNVKWNFWFFRC